MTLRPDLPMYETDGNLEPIRHPEAQHIVAMMDEHRQQQERLRALWRVAWEWNETWGHDLDLSEHALSASVSALGPPPDAAPDKP